MENKVYVGTCFDKQVRFYLVNNQDLVKQIIAMAPIYPTSLIPFVYSLSITGIMGIMEKSDCKIMTVVNGDGPIGKIYAQANNHGDIRGIVSNRYVDLPLKDGHFDICEAVGHIGNIEVTKDFGLKTPFSSETSIIKGDVLTDFSYYFNYSEQTATAISGSVILNQDYNVNASCLLLVQLMPNCQEDVIDKLEQILINNSNIASLLINHDHKYLLKTLFDQYEILEEKTLQYRCDCSYDKILANLNILPDQEKKALKEEPEIEVTCDWCLKKYKINTNDIK